MNRTLRSPNSSKILGSSLNHTSGANLTTQKLQIPQNLVVELLNGLLQPVASKVLDMHISRMMNMSKT